MAVFKTIFTIDGRWFKSTYFFAIRGHKMTAWNKLLLCSFFLTGQVFCVRSRPNFSDCNSDSDSSKKVVSADSDADSLALIQTYPIFYIGFESSSLFGSSATNLTCSYRFILPLLEYRFLVWSSSANSNLMLLDRVLRSLHYFFLNLYGLLYPRPPLFL